MAEHEKSVAEHKEPRERASKVEPIWYMFTYVLEIVSGLIIYFTVVQTSGDERLRMHAERSIVLGIIAIAIGALVGTFLPGTIAWLVNFVVWLYFVYLGFEAYSGIDVPIPGFPAHASSQKKG